MRFLGNGHTRVKGGTMKEKRQRLRLFVCMKTRTDGRSCCVHQGASIVLDKLRRQIFERGETCSHIDVRPSGCLDRCEDGPVVMAFYGQLAEEATPSRELIKASLEDAGRGGTYDGGPAVENGQCKSSAPCLTARFVSVNSSGSCRPLPRKFLPQILDPLRKCR